MNYIVFDLEWNQASSKSREVRGIMFEILEIGAVKLDTSFKVVDTFSSLIRPQVYMTMHCMTRKIIHFNLRDMKQERTFSEVASDFLSWCGEDPIFCTWGPSDLTELAGNMKYYGMSPLSKAPIRYYDVQKLFSLRFDDGKSRLSLENAAARFDLSEPEDFHTALGDARYTADIFARTADENTLRFFSYDTFYLPRSRKDEVHEYFPTYYKYISRSFRTKEALLSDMEVCSVRCSICKKKSRRFVKLFTNNAGRFYLGVSRCPEHGFIKAKLRVKKSSDGRFFAVKTIRPIPEELAMSIKGKYTKLKSRPQTGQGDTAAHYTGENKL